MSQEPQSAQPPAPAPEPAVPAQEAPSRLAWFLIGAAAASACFVGFGMIQRLLVQKMMSGLGLTPAAQTAAPASLDAQVSTVMQQAQQALQTLQPPAQGSSLDLVSGPGGAPARPGSAAPMAPVSPQQAAQQGANLINSVMPMLNNPALMRGLTPDQQKQMQQLVGTIGQLQGSLQSGKPLTPAEQQAMLQQVQQSMKGMPVPPGLLQQQGAAPQRPAPPDPQGNRP